MWSHNRVVLIVGSIVAYTGGLFTLEFSIAIAILLLLLILPLYNAFIVNNLKIKTRYYMILYSKIIALDVAQNIVDDYIKGYEWCGYCRLRTSKGNTQSWQDTH